MGFRGQGRRGQGYCLRMASTLAQGQGRRHDDGWIMRTRRDFVLTRFQADHDHRFAAGVDKMPWRVVNGDVVMVVARRDAVPVAGWPFSFERMQEDRCRADSGEWPNEKSLPKGEGFSRGRRWWAGCLLAVTSPSENRRPRAARIRYRRPCWDRGSRRTAGCCRCRR